MIERLPLSNSRKFDVGPASPRAGPILLIAEIDPLRAVTKSSLKKNVNETVPIMTKEMNKARILVLRPLLFLQSFLYQPLLGILHWVFESISTLLKEP